jgi:hypothetical protein
MAIVLAVQLVFLLSCDKEWRGSGEKVAVSFAASTGDYEESEGAVRRFGTKRNETKVVPIGDDLYLYATLKPDLSVASGEVRVAVPPADGQKVCLEAYTQGTSTCVAAATYTYTGGKLVADGDDPLLVEPGTYDFAAYSYYNSAETPAKSGIDPVKDLVWGRQLNRTIGTGSDAERTVTIKMDHLFSKVRMMIDVSGMTGATLAAPTGVAIEGGSYAALEAHGGTLFAGATLTQTLSWPVVSPATASITSNERLVYPVASPAKAKVKVEGMTISISGVDRPVPDFSIEFDRSLEGGTRYLLEVSLNRTRWAGSNIYWQWNDDDDPGEGGYLTFDVALTNTSYQGVYFKWGSLVGISPAGGSSAATVGDVALYIPDVGSGTWDGTKKINSANPWGSDWGSIPYTTTGTGTVDSYLYDLGDAVYTSYMGDICRYLTDGEWRLPNGSEYGHTQDYDWHSVVGSDPDDPTGRGWMGDAGAMYNYSAFGYVFMPASGERNQNTGVRTFTGTNGQYWCGSLFLSGENFLLWFDQYVQVSSDMGRGYGYPARCIKN